MATQRGHEIPTIDVVLVTIKPANDPSATEIGLNTATKIAVSPQIETNDAIKLIVKGRLIAQKPVQNILTGNAITLTDNVFIPEVVRMLQGGTIKYWQEEDQTTEGENDMGFGVSSYTPPTASTGLKGEVLILTAYSAIYNAAGIITGYEKIEYPNCQGVPISLSSEDNVFRVSEYTINSAPAEDESPYKITFLPPTGLPSVIPLPTPMI